MNIMGAKQINHDFIYLKPLTVQEFLELKDKIEREAFQRGVESVKKKLWASAEETAEMLGVKKEYLSQIRAKPDCCLKYRKKSRNMEYLISSIEEYKNNGK